MRIALLTCYLLLVTSAHALTDAWSINVNDHTAVQRTYKRGESIDMRITLRDGLKPLNLTGATARWYWYTNAVDNLWWTNAAAIPLPRSGIVSAQWTPAMDTGAAMYPYWVGLWMPGATSPLWRVTGTIRLLGSPGLIPNSQPVPVRTLDFAAITLTNAPWVTAADWASGSNALASALQYALTNTVPALISAIPPPSTDALRLVGSNAVDWIAGDGGVWRVSSSSVTNAVTNTVPVSYELDLSADFYTRYDDVPNPGVPLTVPFPWSQAGEFGVWEAIYDGSYYAYVNFIPSNGEYTCTWQGEINAEGTLDGSVLVSVTGDSGTGTLRSVGTTTVDYVTSILVTTQRIDTVALQSSLAAKLAVTNPAVPVRSFEWSAGGLYPGGLTLSDSDNSAASLYLHPEVIELGNGWLKIMAEELFWNNGASSIAYSNIQPRSSLSNDVSPFIAGLATRAELTPFVTGTVLTQATSHVMAQYYDDSGYVTQQIIRVGIEIVTNRWGPRLSLPDGIVTNGQAVVNFGVITNRSSTIVGGVADDHTTDLLTVTDYSGNYLFRVNGVGQVTLWGDRFALYAASLWCGLRDAPIITDYGQLGVGLTTDGGVAIYHAAYPTAKFSPGGLAVTGTVSASSVILPHLGTNTTVSLIFTNNTLQAWEIAP